MITSMIAAIVAMNTTRIATQVTTQSLNTARRVSGQARNDDEWRKPPKGGTDNSNPVEPSVTDKIPGTKGGISIVEIGGVYRLRGRDSFRDIWFEVNGYEYYGWSRTYLNSSSAFCSIKDAHEARERVLCGGKVIG